MHPPELRHAPPFLLPAQQVLDLFDRLREQHRAVAGRTNALHDTCERLVAERTQLEGLAAAIRSKLAYFDELEAVAAQVRSVSASRLFQTVGCVCCVTMCVLPVGCFSMCGAGRML
jgi:hypothetical protein